MNALRRSLDDTESTPFRPAIVLTEFMAANTHTVADETGAFDDWIELHNFGLKRDSGF